MPNLFDAAAKTEGARILKHAEKFSRVKGHVNNAVKYANRYSDEVEYNLAVAALVKKSGHDIALPTTVQQMDATRTTQTSLVNNEITMFNKGNLRDTSDIRKIREERAARRANADNSDIDGDAMEKLFSNPADKAYLEQAGEAVANVLRGMGIR